MQFKQWCCNTVLTIVCLHAFDCMTFKKTDLMCYDTYATTFEHHKLIAKLDVFMTYEVKY